MLRDRYDPMNLFAAIPTLRMQMDPVLTQMDTLLDDDVLFQAVKAALYAEGYYQHDRGTWRV